MLVKCTGWDFQCCYVSISHITTSYGCGESNVGLYVIDSHVTQAFSVTRALTPPGGEDEQKTLIMGCESGKYLMEIPYWLLCTGFQRAV